MSKTYIASPFFSELQLNQVKSLESLLDSIKEDRYSPREFGNSSEISILPEFESIKRQYIFDSNIDQIYKCDKIIVNLYKNKDLGTLFELGVALGRNKLEPNSINIKVAIDNNDSNINIDTNKQKINKVNTGIVTIGRDSTVLGTINYLRNNKDFDKFVDSVDKVLVDTNSQNSYIGGIIILGYLYSLNVDTSYISNFVSKSNLMITQSGIDQFKSIDDYKIGKKVIYSDKDIK